MCQELDSSKIPRLVLIQEIIRHDPTSYSIEHLSEGNLIYHMNRKHLFYSTHSQDYHDEHVYKLLMCQHLQ